MRKLFLITGLVLISFIGYSQFTSCVNACICGYDNDGDGKLDKSEYNELASGKEDAPSFEEVDVDADGYVDAQEVSVVPGCGV